MKCNTCGDDREIPRGKRWTVNDRKRFVYKWICPACQAVCETESLDEPKFVTTGCITGENYDKDRQKALYGRDEGCVRELAATNLNWPREHSVYIGRHGWAPTNESLNSLGKRKEFMRQNTRFEEH